MSITNSKTKLLLKGNSNWDYYMDDYYPTLVIAVAKPDSGAKNCIFGNLDYFNKIVQLYPDQF